MASFSADTIVRSLRPTAKFSAGVSERQIRVVATDATPDRAGDVVVPEGGDLQAFRKNPVILAQHDPAAPIARCSAIGIQNSAIVATIDFPPAGTSARSDEYLGLLKAGVLGAVSIGFLPKKWIPIKGGGLKFEQWEMLELSVCSVPCNPNARVIERSLGRAQHNASRVPLSMGERIRHALALQVEVARMEIANAENEWSLSQAYAKLRRAEYQMTHIRAADL